MISEYASDVTSEERDPMSILIQLMNLRATGAVEVTRTSDGFYLVRRDGEIGYNHFVGKPSPVHPGPGLDQTLRLWAQLSKGERRAVRILAARPLDGLPIPLSEFGIPGEQRI